MAADEKPGKEEMADQDKPTEGQGQPVGGKGNQLRRYGPLVAIVVILVIVVAAVVTASGGNDDEEDAAGSSYCEGGGYTIETEWGEECTLPEGVVPFYVAQDQGLDIDWPETCDTERGEAAVPDIYAPQCFAPFEGDNGGATAQGVTEDSIKVVLYLSPEDDPILSQIYGLFNIDETPEQFIETVENLVPYYHDYYETYGREVDLQIYQGNANMADAEAARADAAAIAEEIQPFAVLGGPPASQAFPDELAARGVLHIGSIGGREIPEYYDEKSPYLLDLDMSTLQKSQHIAEYIGKRLAGRPAEHAGGELVSQERKFGMIFPEADPAAEKSARQFEDALASYDVEVVVESFRIEDSTGAAPRIIGRMKDEDVTSILPVGDPASPLVFAGQATDQEYFPEWILGGAPLADFTAFARFYPQDQWAHAFGVGFGAAPIDPLDSGQDHLYRWYNCSEAPASEGVIFSGVGVGLFFAILQGVGPDLTHQTFRDAAFYAPSTATTLTAPSYSYGPPERGRWDEVDYHGSDDATEIWWDPEAPGLDEFDREGQGMYRYVDGGERFLPGEWPEEDAGAFLEEGSVTYYDDPPPGEEVPEYPSPCE